MAGIDEVRLLLPSGGELCFPAYTGAGDTGVDYVRVLSPQGDERVYWTSQEWAEDPEGVMGALMGAITREFGSSARRGTF